MSKYDDRIFEQIAAAALEDHFEELECPICETACTFIRLNKWTKDDEYTEMWRCLNCLSLFTKELKKVE